jgi:hypothetical protein
LWEDAEVEDVVGDAVGDIGSDIMVAMVLGSTVTREKVVVKVVLSPDITVSVVTVVRVGL